MDCLFLTVYFETLTFIYLLNLFKKFKVNNAISLSVGY